jgi:purine-nucleoside phosphorylase
MTSVKQAAAMLKTKLGKRHPAVALVLGSSLGKLANAAENPLVIPFAKIPGFPRPNVSGHAGNLVVGKIGANSVVMVDGRVHYYETGDPAAMRPIIETLSLLGIRILILLNTAGSLMSDVGPGRLTLITDHINFSGANPLIGERGDERFVPMTDAYDRSLAEAIRRAARAEAIDLAEGTYVWFSGPSFETPAEIRAARALGADAVGMSTVPEVILARRFNLKVAAVSVITNYAAGIKASSPSHSETKLQGARAAGDLERLITSLLDEPLDV